MTRNENEQTGGRRIRLELQPSLESLGIADDAYVVIGNVPAGAHLSAGYGKADRTWSVPAPELGALDIITPEADGQPLVLNVRVVSLDPQRDTFASTIARFDLHVAADGSVSAAPAGQATPGRAVVLNRPRADRYVPLADSEADLPSELREASRAMAMAADARAHSGEALRFAQALAKWQAQEMKRWAYREVEAMQRQRREIAGVAGRLRVVDGEREADLGERWDAKFAELMSAQQGPAPASAQERGNAYGAAAAPKPAAPAAPSATVVPIKPKPAAKPARVGKPVPSPQGKWPAPASAKAAASSRVRRVGPGRWLEVSSVGIVLGTLVGLSSFLL
jgi:hypothetical protein